MDVKMVSTRGFFNLRDGAGIKQDKYELLDENMFDFDEITIVIHGMRNTHKDAIGKAVMARDALSKLGYDKQIVGFSYDANTVGLNELIVARLIAERNGKLLCNLIEDYKRQNSNGKVRLIGHSLGSRVIASALESLIIKVESIHLFGAGITPDRLADDAFRTKNLMADSIVNYYYPYDEVLLIGSLYNPPLGLYGARGIKIENYTEHIVYAGSHRFQSYLKKLKQFP